MKNNMEYIVAAEKRFAELMDDIDKIGDYGVVVPIDDRWEYILPSMRREGMEKEPELMTIQISGWTREETYYNLSSATLHITTAFGEEENTAEFESSEIFALLDDMGNPIHSKTYNLKTIVSPAKPVVKENYTLKGLIDNPDTDDVSMNAMKKNNPKIFKGDGK